MPDDGLDELRQFLDERTRDAERALAAQDFVDKDVYPILRRVADMLRQRRLPGATDHPDGFAVLTIERGREAFSMTYSVQDRTSILCTLDVPGGAEERWTHALSDVTPELIAAEVTAFVKRVLG